MGFGKDNKGAIIREQATIALGALAAGAAIKLNTLAILEDFRILKSEVSAVVRGLTAGQGEGLKLGIANNNLTVAEIANCIFAQGPLNRSDRTLQEEAERQVRLFGAPPQMAGAIEFGFLGIEGGPMMEIKPRWTYSNPDGWCFFVFNDTVVLTTGATINLLATHFGMWVS